MKKVCFVLCFSPVLFGNAYLHAEVAPYLAPRSESAQAARELVGIRDHINRCGMDSLYGTFFVMPGYDRTFKADRITEILFCDALSTGSARITSSCCAADDHKNLNISGSQVVGRGGRDLLADYFGLSTDFQSMVNFAPVVSNFFMDFNLYLGLDRWCEGCYFRIHAPLVHTRWKLGFCEHDVFAGALNHPAGYFNQDLTQATIAQTPYGVVHTNLLQTFEDFACNEKAPNLGNVVAFEPLRHAKMYKCTKSDNKLSDVQMALGWNFWQDEDYHFGVQIRAAAPTGSRLHAEYLFEPIVGNGHHWEIGGGFSGHWVGWRSEDEDNDFSLYLEANVTHLCKTRQCRTFDLCCRPLSRYVLAQKMTSPAVNLMDLTETAPNAQFANVFTPVANLTTMNVDVSADGVGNFALLLAWNYRNWGLDVGYEFFGQSSEKICKSCCTTTLAENTWALKGDAYVYGFTVAGADLANPTALSASERLATIFKGTNAGTTEVHQNKGVDNAKEAYRSPGVHLATVGYETTAANVSSSFHPVFLKESNIDMTGTRIMSQKVFAHINYSWKDREGRVPFVGIGGEAEIGHADEKCCPKSCGIIDCTSSCTANTCVQSCTASCNTCFEGTYNEGRDVAMWRWGIWIKGGVSFD